MHLPPDPRRPSTFPLLPGSSSSSSSTTTTKRPSASVLVLVAVLVVSVLTIGTRGGAGAQGGSELSDVSAWWKTATGRTGYNDGRIVEPVVPVSELVDDEPLLELLDDEEADDEALPAGVPVPASALAPVVGETNASDEVEDEGQHLPIVALDEFCPKTMLYRLHHKHGLTSEFSLLLRVAALAKHHGFTMIVDSSEWNYGSWDEYFVPLDVGRTCVLPLEENIKRKHFGADGWESTAHVVWARDVDLLDTLFVSTFITPSDMAALKELDAFATDDSGAGEVVPRPFHRAYEVLREAAGELWRVNKEMEKMVRTAEKRIRAGEKVGAKTKRIGVHVRLGDKYLEADKIGPQKPGTKANSHKLAGPGLHQDALARYIDTSRSLFWSIVPKTTPPTARELVVMSDLPNAWQYFKREKLSGIRVVGTDDGTKKHYKRVAADGNPLSKLGGFSETAFNKFPLSTRVALTKEFIRDLTLLSRSSAIDGLVISGSSNVGRLMVLLAGEKVEQKRIKSVDTRWFPTARYL